MVNGMLAGLVAITAPCAFVAPWAATVIGIVAGALVCWSVEFFDKKARVDDPCGAISVHGMCGAWGVLAVGLFADGTYGIGWNGVSTSALHGVQGIFYDRDDIRFHGRDERLKVQSFYEGQTFLYQLVKRLTGGPVA